MANGDTPLHSAIRRYDGDLHPVKLLLKQNDSDINVANSEGETPLHLAARNESCFSEELIEFLLEGGADVNVVDANGDTPLHLIAQNTAPIFYHITKPVLSMRSNVESKLLKENADDAKEKAPPARKPLSEIVDSEVRRGGGWTKVPSTIPASVKLLLKHADDVNAVNSEGDTPLHFAARNKTWCFHLLRMFLKQARDVNASNSKGETPLHAAVRSESCNVALIKVLLDHGADVGKEDAKGENAYQAYCRAVSEDKNREPDAMLKILLQSSEHQYMDSSLHVASLFHNVDSVKKLLSTGADVNDVEKFGYPPLFYALVAYADNADKIADNKSSTVKLLLHYDTDINHQFPRSNFPTKCIFEDDMSLLSLGIAGLVEGGFEEFKTIFNIFQDHQAKLLALHEKRVERGISVQMLSKFNLRFGGPIERLGELFKTEQMNLFLRCYDELTVMSETKVGESEVTFLDLLVADDKKTGCYAKNERLMGAFRAEKDRFPLYEGMLATKLAKGLKRRNELVESTADFFSKIKIACSFVYRMSQNVCRRFLRRFI